MSRKTLLTVILALAVVLFTAPQVLAVGVSASRHDMTADGMDLAASFTGIEDRGVCSFCHVPHGGGTERLWAGTMGSLPGVGTVANLCYSCHNDPAIVGAGTSTKMFTPSTNTVHGYDETFMPGEGNNLAGSGFPYIGDADTIIECTTCHNVHVQDNAPFLRAAFQDFCQNCHTGRQGTGEMNANMNGSGFSTHPILTLTTTPDANRPVVIPGRYDLPIAGTTSAAARVAMWTIGGHRNASSEVICQTCHAVHGYDPAAEAAGAEVGYNDSDAFGAAVLVDAFMIGGTGGAYGNEICVNCHGENPNTGPGGVIGINHRYSAGANRADVGNTGDANESTSGNSLEFWGAPGFPTDTGRLVCSSCHDVHFGSNASPIFLQFTDYSVEGSGDVCVMCHQRGPGNCGSANDITTGKWHHPQSSWAGACSSGYTLPASGTATLAGVSNWENSTEFDCTNCHRAHNAVDQGLDAAGYDGTDQAEFILVALNYDPANGTPTSQICVDCHTLTPVDDGLASHFVSNTATMGDYTSIPGRAAAKTWPVPQKLNDWDAGAAASYSKYGGVTTEWAQTPPATGGGQLCESCHSITNPVYGNMLLGDYSKTLAGEPGVSDTICQGCHSDQGSPPYAGTHPVTGSTVSVHGGTLNTTNQADGCATATTPGSYTVDGNALFYPAADQLSCVSCHDVHQSDPTTGGWIMRPGNDGIPALGSGSGSGRALVDINDGVADITLNFTDMCAACHTTYE